jgi:hypothetical protein
MVRGIIIYLSPEARDNGNKYCIAFTGFRFRSYYTRLARTVCTAAIYNVPVMSTRRTPIVKSFRTRFFLSLSLSQYMYVFAFDLAKTNVTYVAQVRTSKTTSCPVVNIRRYYELRHATVVNHVEYCNKNTRDTRTRGLVVIIIIVIVTKLRSV